MSLYSNIALGASNKFCFFVEQTASSAGLAEGVATKCYDSLYANLDKISIDTSE